MADIEKTLSSIKELGNAQITGIGCNNGTHMTLRFEVQIPLVKMRNVLNDLNLKSASKLIDPLEATLKPIESETAVKKAPPREEKLLYVC
jgi:hypothetical protein